MAAGFEQFKNEGSGCLPAVRKLGIMGGTFDPIHIGHLACAEQVRCALGLDAVLFMPAGDPWMKRGRKLAPAEDRFAMVRLAVQGNPYFHASRLEIDRPGQTYTVDTLRALQEQCGPGTELYFILGADSVLHVHKWREAERLSELATLVAVTRPGYSLEEARRAYRREFGADLRIVPVQATSLDISSTDLREKAAAGLSVRYLVPQDVANYMAAHNLYRNADAPEGGAS